ncbi:hypothetical protein SKAU_G00012480 [Synaphobranchus kaupii]|uniref:Uncharacterized protein n=1 Tax=Synaphobranchus kaupii TaxID=118154 RepID=A0A9Q1GBE3_SYNKA|nr:hypothetical protein SKAU_G00012480 [Synaphobranchus kaupii]
MEYGPNACVISRAEVQICLRKVAMDTQLMPTPVLNRNGGLWWHRAGRTSDCTPRWPDKPCRLFFLTWTESRLFSSVFFIDGLNKIVNGRIGSLGVTFAVQSASVSVPYPCGRHRSTVTQNPSMQ